MLLFLTCFEDPVICVTRTVKWHKYFHTYSQRINVFLDSYVYPPIKWNYVGENRCSFLVSMIRLRNVIKPRSGFRPGCPISARSLWCPLTAVLFHFDRQAPLRSNDHMFLALERAIFAPPRFPGIWGISVGRRPALLLQHF